MGHLIEHTLDAAFDVAFGEADAIGSELDQKSVGFVDFDAALKGRFALVGDARADRRTIGIFGGCSVGVDQRGSTEPIFGRTRNLGPMASSRGNEGIRKDGVVLGAGLGAILGGIAQRVDHGLRELCSRRLGVTDIKESETGGGRFGGRFGGDLRQRLRKGFGLWLGLWLGDDLDDRFRGKFFGRGWIGGELFVRVGSVCALGRCGVWGSGGFGVSFWRWRAIGEDDQFSRRERRRVVASHPRRRQQEGKRAEREPTQHDRSLF